MKTTQGIIKTYLYKRIAICVIVALCTFTLTLGTRFILQRSVNQQQIDALTLYAVNKLNNILQPLETQREAMSLLVGQSCDHIHPTLRRLAAELQTVRTIALVKSGLLYCSSALSERNILVQTLQPTLPSYKDQLILALDHSLLRGSPILIQWFPTSKDGLDGVMVAINIGLVSNTILEPTPPLVSQINLHVGDNYYQYDTGISTTLISTDKITYTRTSKYFPFSVTAISPGAEYLALRDLTSDLPLAIIITALLAWVAWLVTAGRMSFSREISMGIANKEFPLYCQPLIDTNTQRCTGVEILLRWHNPRIGWIAPDVFIPIAEERNLIIPLTQYVIRETANQRHYFPHDEHFHIGINIAATHFKEGQLLKDIQRYWCNTAPIQQLMLELTERDSLSHVDHQTRHELNQHQLKLAIDDFGTGNSSLSWLEMLRPDVLKIDKSFTHAIGTDAVNSTVTDIIIALGRRLDIELVAEGVETYEQANYLRRHGVRLLQGYLYAQPMPIEELPQWLAAHRPPV